MMKTLTNGFYTQATTAPQTNVRRSKMEIHLDILETISRGYEKPTRIMFSANISWMALQRALSDLESNELIAKVDENSRSLYSITEKGYSVLEKYESVRKTISVEQSAEPRPNKMKDLILDSVERGLILDSVERGLNNVLGTEQKVMYHRINENFGLGKEDIPDKPEDFLRALRKIFKGGSAVIERAIASEMSDFMESIPERVPFHMTSNYLKKLEAVQNERDSS